MRWSKAAGYVGGLSILISVMSQIATQIIPEEHALEQRKDVLRWASYLWAYASAIMGIYLAKTMHQVRELLYGIFVAALCLSFKTAIVIAMVYSFRSFVKLDRMGRLPI